MESSEQKKDGLITELDWLIRELEYGARQSPTVSQDTIFKLKNLYLKIRNWEPEEVSCSNCAKLEELEDLVFDSNDDLRFEKNIDIENASTGEILDEVLYIIKDKIGI